MPTLPTAGFSTNQEEPVSELVVVVGVAVKVKEAVPAMLLNVPPSKYKTPFNSKSPLINVSPSATASVWVSTAVPT